MTSVHDGRPSLWRPSAFALTWQSCTWIGWALLLWSIITLTPTALRAMGLPFLMIAAVVVLSELRPIVMTRLEGNPVSISLAFVFATMYLWGFFPAAVLYAITVALSELLQRKALWKLLFNVGQYTCSLAAAWLVLLLVGESPAPTAIHGALSAPDALWVVGSWVVYHLVNLALVSGLSADEDETWWESFTDEFWFYTAAAFAVLALSPLIAVVAIAYPYSWTLLPLLLLPLLAVQKTAEMSRHQEHQALHDPLTGLPNRLLLTDRIEQALARSSRTAGRVVVMFLDLDLFKVVNDSLGHHAGDALLVDVAFRVQAATRSGDTAARLGGDEFAFCFEDVSTEEAWALADRITSALREPFASEDRQVTVTASVGVALDSPTCTAQTLLRDADTAMYRAKEAGRDGIVMFDEAMHQQANARLEDSVGLRRALERGEFRTFYQPVVNLVTGRTVGLEALVRWDHPDRGLIGPQLFIPVAEETGLIVAIGDWVLDDALARMHEWQLEYPQARDLWIAVNISSRQLRAPGLVTRVASALEETGIQPASVRLEITESAVMIDLEPVVDTLMGLRGLGLSLAVDDFGTGYSSLAYLKRLPVNTLKIDRSFIDGLGGADDAFDRPIVDAIIKMAQSLRLGVIAEGVETEAQLRTLMQIGGRVGQGFLFSAPLSEDAVPAWLMGSRSPEPDQITAR